MEKTELMEILELENWEEFQYFEQFLLLMEHYNEIDEEVFLEVFTQISDDELACYFEMYFDDMITGIPEDNMDVYKIFSTVKSILTAMAKEVKTSMRVADNLVFELIRFQNWMMEEAMVKCIHTQDDTVEEVSIWDALILFRIERLNIGKYRLQFPDDISYHIDEFEGAESHIFNDEDSMDEEETYLIDPENPVII